MTWVIIMLCILIVALKISKIVIKFQERFDKNQREEIQEKKWNNAEYLPYVKKYLLTKNEYYFYGKLKSVAEKYDLQILTKVRLADLIETEKGLSYKEKGKYFNRIKAKHIDFILVDNMKVVLLIELDDSSHRQPERIERDYFLNAVMQKVGYNFIRTYGDTECIEYYLSQLTHTA